MFADAWREGLVVVADVVVVWIVVDRQACWCGEWWRAAVVVERRCGRRGRRGVHGKVLCC